MKNSAASILVRATDDWYITYLGSCPFCHLRPANDMYDHHCKGSDKIVFAVRTQEDKNRRKAGLEVKEYCHDEERNERKK